MSDSSVLEAATEALFSGDYARAKILYQSLLHSGERQGKTMLIAHCKQHLGILAQFEGEDDTSEHLFNEALSLYQQHDNKSGQASLLDIMARFETDQFKRLDYHERSLELKEQLGDIPGQINTLQSLGDIAMEGGDTATAEFYRQRAKELQG